MASDFAWDTALLSLHYYGQRKPVLPFRVEKVQGVKVWTEHRTGCLVKSRQDKHSTSVRVQFCKTYYDKPIQFSIEVDKSAASTALPIVLLREGPYVRVYFMFQCRSVPFVCLNACISAHILSDCS